MGALPADPRAAPEKDPAELIRAALAEKDAGNSLNYLRLVHALSGKSSAQVTTVLTGLTHHTASLHTTPSSDLAALLRLALELPLEPLTAPAADATYPMLDALQNFLLNLVSADASFVEPVFHALARRLFVLQGPSARPATAHLFPVLSAALDLHPRADRVLAAVLRARFPHPVRPAAEHAAYLRAALCVARQARSRVLVREIVAVSFERLGAVEALVPAVLHGESGLVREADRVEVVMLEHVRHAEIACRDGEADYRDGLLQLMHGAYAAAIVPIEGCRFGPYVMMHAASVAGIDALWDVVDRLWHVFCDHRVNVRLRDKFLQHAAAMVVRSRLVGPERALKWVADVAKWLNRYVDAVERHDEAVVDADVHYLFYAACNTLMTTVAGRPDALKCAGGDVVDRMRLYRVMACGMNPLLVLDDAVVSEFGQVVQRVCGMDLSEIMEENRGRYTPSRTRYGERNVFKASECCPELELARIREKLREFVRGAEVENEERADDEDVDVDDLGDRMDVAAAEAEDRLGFAATLKNPAPDIQV